MFIEWVLWGMFGLIIGSFVNVLILREGTGKGIGGRSACPVCTRELAWFELVPVLSWVLLLGRCRTCRARISLQYPLVELAVAVGFIAVGLAPVPMMERMIGAAIFALCVAIFVYDLYHTIIPNTWSYVFGALALVTMFATGATSAFALAAGPLVALPLFALWLFSRGTWMGFGDVKLALGIGWLLGILGSYVALMLGFIFGALVGVFILLPLPRIVHALSRAGPMRWWLRLSHGAGITRVNAVPTYTMRSEVPFGPFLICSTVLVWFSQLYSLGLEGNIVAFLSLS